MFKHAGMVFTREPEWVFEPAEIRMELLLGLDSLAIEDVQAALPGVARRTLQRDLQVLVEKRIAVAEGAAKARRYGFQDKSLS